MGKRKFFMIVLLTMVSAVMLLCAVFFTACAGPAPEDGSHNTEQGGENEPGTNPDGDSEEPGQDPDEGENEKPQEIAVISVSLNKTELTLEEGEEYTLIATISPANATDKSITWTSSKASVAAVTDGKVAAKEAGMATITARTGNGKTAVCTVIVEEPAPEVIEVTSVSLNQTSLTLEIGESEILTATVLPSNATDQSVTWSSSNASVVSVSGGTVTAVSEGSAAITARTSNGKTATCSVTVSVPVCVITSVEGATIDGTDIFMFVDHTTSNVPLLNKVTVSSGSWDLYSDILGQNRIPTKIAAGTNGSLADGENTFYIMLEDNNGGLVAVYTLTVYRSYSVTVSYYNQNTFVYSEPAYTGYTYDADYEYSATGYTFNYWLEDGEQYQSRVLWAGLSLFADMTANSYTITLDANGGEISGATQTVTYDETYAFPVPEWEGHTFLGWYAGGIQLTDKNGQSLSAWSYADDIEVTAEWQINSYNVSIAYDSGAGTVTGAKSGIYDYGTKISLTASSPNLGYDFLGWYDGDDNLLAEEYEYSFTLGADDVALTAKYEVWEDLAPFTFTFTADTCTITGVKDKSVTELVVPDYVTEIAAGAFSGCSSLTSITLPFIGGSANATEASSSTLFGYIFGTSSYTGGTATQQGYASSSSMTYYIPTTLESVTITGGNIFYGAFGKCTNLTKITIGNDVTSIGIDAFRGCTSLTEVHITDLAAWCAIDFASSSANPLYYARNLYLNGELVTKLEIPSGVTSIGRYAFYNCTSLTSVTIGDSVTSIGSSAFSGCTGLTEINWNAVSVADFSSNSKVFYNAGTAVDGIMVTFGESVQKIPAYLFYSSSYSPNVKSVIIGNGVTSIGRYAFYNCTSLTEVTIPDSVTSIGECIFASCSALTSINVEEGNAVYHSAGNCVIETATGTLVVGCNGSVIPADGSVTSIGDYAFYGCTSLTEVTIPDSVTSIGSYAFSGCANIESAIMPTFAIDYIPQDSLKTVVLTSGDSIGSSAFEDCTSLTSVTIGDSVTSIGSSAFSGCTGLTEINWNAVSVADFDSNSNVFYDAGTAGSGITVTFGESVQKIPAYAFYDCKWLTEINWNAVSVADFDSNSKVFYNAGTEGVGITVTFGESVQEIPAYLFCANNSSYRPNIKSVTIGNSVTSIGSNAFSGCTGLTSITIPDSVTSIGWGAFYNCTGLTSVTIPDIAAWCAIDFGNDTTANPLYYAENLYLNGELVTEIVIPDGVTSIGSPAFEGCTSLISVTIPDSVTSIGSSAFEGCTSLTEVHITDIAAWCAIDFGSYDANPLCYAHNLYLNGELVTELVIPDGVTSIGDYAFYGCTSLTSVTIPDSVTSIGERAFYGCYKLIEVYNRSALDIRAGSSSNGYVAYYAEHVYTAESDSWLTDTAEGFRFFYDGTNAYLMGYYGDETEITLPNSFTAYDGTEITEYAIYDYAFRYCTSLISVTIPDSVTSIGNYAFDGCTSLTSVTIPDSVTSIGRYAFYNCTGLTSVTIPGSVASIGSCAFYNCTGLTSVIIPDSVTSIGDGAFSGCTSLTTVTIGDSVMSIGHYAFSGCTGLTEINWNAVSVAVDAYSNVFYDAGTAGSGITVTFGESVQKIPAYLFYVSNSSCRPNVKSVVVGDSVTSIGSDAFYYCTGLTSVTIGDSVTSIGERAFYNCTGLTEINWNAVSVADFDSNSNVFYNAGTAGAGITVTFGESVQKIPAYLFDVSNSSYPPNVKSVIIGNGVTSIGESAFEDCDSLTSVTIGNSVTSIGDEAFRGCTGLTSVTIPDSVTSIGLYAFYGCTGLTSVTFEETSGWFVKTSSSATSGTNISSGNLSNKSTAAKYLTSTYSNYYWKRNA